MNLATGSIDKLCVVFLVFSFMIVVLGNSYDNIFAQESSNQHEIKGQDTVYSQYVPLYGTFSVQMEYSIPLEILSTELVHAGSDFDILVTANKPGKLVTIFLQDEKILGTFEDELKIGEEKTIEIPESLVGQVFAMPHIQIQPIIRGPATITPESVLFDSEDVRKFQVFVNENIGAFDSLKVEMNVIIKMKNGGNVNLAIAKIPLGEHTSDIQTQNVAKQIQLQKIVPTNLHLQVNQGDLSEHVKVKTILTDDLQIPITLLMHSVEIYVDGLPQAKIQPNEWSENIFVGGGTHNFQARFSEIRDPNNIAITYTDADSAVQTITVISNKTSVVQEIQCESGMIFKDGQCVKEENQDSFFGMEGGGCLIATATYGSEMAPQVQLLREIRDGKVMTTNSGASFMTGFNQAYYSFSPYIADYERENPAFKELVKIGITPMLSSLSIMSMADSEEEVLGYGIGVILMNIGMYLVVPVIVIWQVRKRI